MLITDTPFIMKRATLLVACRKFSYQGTAKNDHYDMSQVVDHHCLVPKTTQVSWQVSLACVLIFELSRCVRLSRQLSEF